MAEPGITQTDILKLNKPDKGYFDWDVPLNENWDKLDFLGAGQLPLLYRLESERILEGADATGWALQGSVLDGDTYPTLWTLLKTAKDRAASKTLEIKEITYTVAQDEVTGMVFVDQANYDKGWANLKDSLGFIVSFVDEVKSITLPKRAVYDRADVEGLNGFGAESLPNITGSFGNVVDYDSTAKFSGAFERFTSHSHSVGAGGQVRAYNSSFDASRSSSTYQDGASVQPDHHVVYAYYKVGNTVVNSGQIDMGNVLGTLASLETSKAGTDLLNVTAVGKARSISWGMPDYSAKIEVPWNTEVTRNYPCFVNVFPNGTVRSSVVKITINNVVIGIYDEGGESGSSGSGQFFIPANTPYKVSGGYQNNGTIYEFPLQGVN